MTSADEFALSLYIPILLLLTVVEIVLGAYESSDGMWNKQLAAGKLLLNMAWTSTLFPLLLDIHLFTFMIDSLYEGRPDVASPLSGDGIKWFSIALVFLLFLVNTIDVYQSFRRAENSAHEKEIS
ncbi:hypothetical protein [Sporosarcina gallistercoris]|uniref:Uncharacterized protein n=1 Tax=Sporosarcina gallistercoris TaxID=2762245 RepID=A0ABR8PI91_9BACL|nr:hypothetical protein [Sporosarcina gallistercoris]MBD7907863.1 hypothetical protein [Sporosarcina gallistercoris]